MFYALTLQASASPADTTYANQIKSAAILEKLYDQNPQHPGVTHFLIPAYDYHPLAEKGIPAARRYAGIAPAVPQARHMPSHIYSMTGLWEESIASNASALEISKRAHRGGRSDRVRSCLQDGPRRHRVQAHGLALPLEPLGGLAPEQEPGLRCSEGRAGGRLATASAFGDFRDVLNTPRATRWTRKLKAASSIIA